MFGDCLSHTSCDHSTAGDFSPLPSQLLHPALHSWHVVGTQHTFKEMVDDAEARMDWSGAKGEVVECKCLPQSLDFILNGYQGDTEGFKYRSHRASSVEDECE